ncbi:MAG: hypothetical protein ISR77_35180 [Pirellulaceae bacterium]|nr:hypothetical protein [Pirellulaceae bacterium]
MSRRLKEVGKEADEYGRRVRALKKYLVALLKLAIAFAIIAKIRLTLRSSHFVTGAAAR